MQKTRNGLGRCRKLWPKNAHADTLLGPLLSWLTVEVMNSKLEIRNFDSNIPIDYFNCDYFVQKVEPDLAETGA